MASWTVPFVICIGYVVVAIIIGVSSARGRIMSKVEEWGVANRTLGFVVMYFLNAAGIISAFSMLGAPGFAYGRGIAITYLILYVTFQEIFAFYLAPRVWDMGRTLGQMTQAQAVAERYESKALGAFFAIVTSFGLLSYAVTQSAGMGYVLTVMSRGAVPFQLAVPMVLIAMVLYIYIGGIRAIGWTNVFQGILMFALAWVAGIYVMRAHFGSSWFGQMYRELLATSPGHLTLPGVKGDWTYRFWTSSILVSIFSIWPTGWVWWMGARDKETLRRTIALMPLFLLLMIPTLALGFSAVMLVPGLKAVDEAALTLAVRTLPPVLSGVLGAGVLAAAMSSAEPCFHVTALTYAVDVIGPIFHVPKEKVGPLARILVPIVVLGIVLPFAIMRPATLVYVTLIGYGFLGQAFPPLMGLFLWPRATKEGAAAGLIAGFVVTTILRGELANPLGIHSGIWGLLFNTTLFIIVSLLTRPSRREVIEKFFPDMVGKIY